MVAKNDITGDALISRKLSPEGEANWDNIFPPKKKLKYIPPPLPSGLEGESKKGDDSQE